MINMDYKLTCELNWANMIKDLFDGYRLYESWMMVVVQIITNWEIFMIKLMKLSLSMDYDYIMTNCEVDLRNGAITVKTR